VIIHLDTSALVDALTGPRRSLPTLVRLVDEGHRVTISALVLYEWLRGPRRPAELAIQEELFPRESIAAFGPPAASLAAKLYGRVSRARGSELDLAVAASALSDGASLWTLNRADFKDIPDLRLV
jgi:predicted nucleic acid-binding protein